MALVIKQSLNLKESERNNHAKPKTDVTLQGGDTVLILCGMPLGFTLVVVKALILIKHSPT